MTCGGVAPLAIITLCLKDSSRISRLVNGAEVLVNVLKVARDCNHCRIVGGVREAWNVDVPTFLFGALFKGIAQSRVS